MLEKQSCSPFGIAVCRLADPPSVEKPRTAPICHLYRPGGLCLDPGQRVLLGSWSIERSAGIVLGSMCVNQCHYRQLVQLRSLGHCTVVLHRDGEGWGERERERERDLRFESES